MKKHFLIASSFLLLSGCSLSFPTVAEQKELLKRGHFPERVPAWVSRPAQLGYDTARQSGGAFPESFGVPGAMPGIGPATGLDRQAEDREERLKQIKERDEKVKAMEGEESEKKEDSPLGRIEAKCPNLESQVVDAITTTETSPRKRKLLSLTQRCPLSWDLWFWLAQAYEKEERYGDAENCLNQVLLLDKGNKEAEEFLKQVKEKNAKPQ